MKKKTLAKTTKPKASKTNKASTHPMVASDKAWQAEDDVRTLMRAEEIKRDKARLKKAQDMAKKKAEEAAKVAKL